MSRIRRVEPFELGLAEPLVTATGTITTRRGFLVTVSHGDVETIGEATPLAGWTEPHERCGDALERARASGDSLETLIGDMKRTPAARHAVESALAVARARQRDVSLASYLSGDTAPGSVAVNATVGHGTPAETVRAGERALAEGFETLKLKVGVEGVQQDIDRVRAIRELAADHNVRVDANGAWTLEQAQEFLRAASELDVEFVEQPLEPGRAADSATLRELGVPIALDESLGTIAPERLFDAGAADVIVLKPMAVGGPVAALSLSRMAADSGVRSVVTTTIDGAYARASATHLAAAIDSKLACGLATADRLSTDLVTPDPLPVEAGRIRLPGTLGDW